MGRIILVDKPKGITSFDVCFKMRKIFGTRKIGHTGTLDPNATGLMMILIGPATKISQFVVSARKEYIATVKTGIRTDTEDIDGEVLEEKKEEMPDKDRIAEVLASFLGESLQIPPMTSAIKVNGKKLYEYQREGREVELKPRKIEVFSIELLAVKEDTFTFKTNVSSGTYIRTLAQDILNKLGIIGTLSELRRTKIDDFSVEDASTISDLENGHYDELDTLEVLSRYYPVTEVENREDIISGKPLEAHLEDETILCAYKGEALAIYRREGDLYRCVRGLL
ncbi:MAG: tRNA pseudouridine(55) synthase TruB [Erysipelotrichaceae bacterium]|nr:tRNA pseudouridine(55) synthase TruB [Erysipelotrichaceae bacterium]